MSAPDRPTTQELQSLRDQASAELAEREAAAATKPRASSSENIAREIVRSFGDALNGMRHEIADLRQEQTTMAHAISSRFAAVVESQQTTQEEILRVAQEDAQRAEQSQRTLTGLLTYAETAEAREARREAREMAAAEQAELERRQDRERKLKRDDEDRALQLEFRRKLLWAFGAIVTALVGAVALWLGVT